MVQYFKSDPNQPKRALQIWLILIGLAHNRQTITYGKLADLLEFRGAGVLAAPLGHIMYWCQHNGLPGLTVLVVNQDSGLPGQGLVGVELNAGREDVFKYNWYGLVPPTVDELRDAYAQGERERRAAESSR
jgi:hypothetical protein